MPNRSGVWNLNTVLQAKNKNNWPSNPGAPTGVSATAGDAEATVSFTPPSFKGIPDTIIDYRATSTPEGITATASSSPITVTGLTNGTGYTFTVAAQNELGYGAEGGPSGSVTPFGPRALFAGGNSGSGVSNVIDYIVFASTGNATDFGDLATAKRGMSGCSSSSRALFGAGTTGSASTSIEYVEFGSLGNASAFGNLSVTSGEAGAISNSTRGVFAGGNGYTNSMSYVTIATTGGGLDFGDLTVGRQYMTQGCASSTRGVFSGGFNGNYLNTIDYITIATTGNATDFGDLTLSRFGLAGCSNSTRGVWAGGVASSVGVVNNIDYITIASAGNATDFGDLTVKRGWGLGSAASSTQAVFSGGEAPSSVYSNVIDYVTIASTGNATDWGDLTAGRSGNSGCSSAHGGLA